MASKQAIVVLFLIFSFTHNKSKTAYTNYTEKTHHVEDLSLHTYDVDWLLAASSRRSNSFFFLLLLNSKRRKRKRKKKEKTRGPLRWCPRAKGEGLSYVGYTSTGRTTRPSKRRRRIRRRRTDRIKSKIGAVLIALLGSCHVPRTTHSFLSSFLSFFH